MNITLLSIFNIADYKQAQHIYGASPQYPNTVLTLIAFVDNNGFDTLTVILL